MECPVCHHDNAPGAKFCSECGTRLELRCPVCSSPYEAGAKFCSECGNRLAAPAPAAPAPAAPDDTGDLARYVPEELLRRIRAAQSGQSMRGERRTVTMLFADIQGSTAAAEHLDPEEWAEIVNGAFGHLIEPIYGYEGTLARLQGDAILAFFGAPIAHEDDPVRAVRAGLDIVAGTRPYITEVADRFGVDIEVRVGINTGLVVVGEVGSDLRVEYTALGDAINVAARMEQTAMPGTVQVTGETRALLGDVFDVVDIGPIEVKGKSEPVPAYRIVGLAGRVDDAGSTTPLLGREAELDALDEVVLRLGDGLGAITTIIGEAGIGKSRLLQGMLDRTSATRTVAAHWSDPGDVSWMRGRARSYERNVPHATFTDVLCTWWGTSGGDDCFDLILAAVEGVTGQPDADLAGFLAQLAGAPLPDPQARLVDSLSAPALHERSTAAFVTYLRAEAARRPVVLVLDDLHWADAMTLTLVEHLMDLCEAAPLALVLVMRPARDDPAWRLVEVAGRDHAHVHTSLELEALPTSATEKLLDALLGDQDVDPVVRRDILERSNGNPLFVEEIARSLGDSGATGPVDVPASLMGLLVARLDGLDEEARATVQVASVIGREFDLHTLAAVADGWVEDESQLRELVKRGILEERRRVPVPSFSFRHPLIREAAYSTVLLRSRRDLHGRIARHLADHAPDAAQEVARHYVEAGDPEAAFPFLLTAGHREIRAMALGDAITHFMVALESPPADATPEQIRAAHEGLGEAYSLVPDLNSASAAYQSLLDYGRATGKPDIEVTALNRLGFSTAALSGDVAGAMKYLQQAKILAESIGDQVGLAEYHMNACMVTTMTGDLAQAVEHDDETARLGELVGDPHVQLLGMARKAANLVSLLRFEDAMVATQDALRVGEELGNEDLVAVLRCNCLGTMALVQGDLAQAGDLFRNNLPTLDRYASDYGGFSHRSMAELAMQTGECEVALAEFAMSERIGGSGSQPYSLAAGLAGRARVLAACGLVGELEDLRSQALEATALPAGEFLATSVLADVAIARMWAGDVDGARDDFAQALVTSGVTAHWERPRVLAGLARVAMAQDQLALAGEHIGEMRDYVATKGLGLFEPELLVLDGRLALLEGRRDDARMLLVEATRAAGEIGARPMKAEALASLAGLQDANGEAAEAAATRTRARAVVDEMAGEILDEDLRRGFLGSASEIFGGQPLIP